MELVRVCTHVLNWRSEREREREKNVKMEEKKNVVWCVLLVVFRKYAVKK